MAQAPPALAELGRGTPAVERPTFWELTGLEPFLPLFNFFHAKSSGLSAHLKVKGARRAVNIASPFVVVPVIIAVFTASILFATSSKEDSDSSHE
jgi:hypothetical protein